MLDFLRNIRNAAIGKVDVELEFREILKEINCHYDINEDEEHNVKRYYFDFQSGNFVAAFYNGVGVEVTFPNCFTVPVEEIDFLRLNCNRFNGSSLFHRYIYSTNEEENKLNLHISFFCDDLRRHLVNLLKACFQTQRDFIDEYNKVKERNGEEQNSLDPEHRFALDSRELFLIRKMEMAHQANTTQGLPTAESTADKPLLLCDMLERLFPIIGAEFTTMTITTGDKVAFKSGDAEIRKTETAQLIITADTPQPQFRADQVTATVNFKAGHTNDPERTVIVHLKAEGASGNSMFYRITATLIQQEVNRANTVESHSNRPCTISFLARYSGSSEKQRDQEFNYMWEEAKIKLKEGKYKELSDDQKLLAETNETNVAYNLYWGQIHLRDERYYQALLHFENAYNSMRDEVFTYDDSGRYNFYEVCYYVGFCYAMLKCYEKAFFYLNLVSGTGKIRFATTNVNVLANSGDVRTLSVIDGIMEEIKREYNLGDSEDNDDIPEHIIHFINFLRRRRAYTLIEFDMLDEAETMLTPMLNEPENSEFAIDELAYLHQRRIQLKESGKDELPS